MHVDLAIVFSPNAERNSHAQRGAGADQLGRKERFAAVMGISSGAMRVQHSNVRCLVIEYKTRIVAGAWSGLFRLVGELIFILVSPVLFPDQTAHDQQGALEVET